MKMKINIPHKLVILLLNILEKFSNEYKKAFVGLFLVPLFTKTTRANNGEH